MSDQTQPLPPAQIHTLQATLEELFSPEEFLSLLKADARYEAIFRELTASDTPQRFFYLATRLRPLVAEIVDDAFEGLADRIVSWLRQDLSVSPPAERLLALSDLLSSLFSPDELRRLPLSRELLQSLPLGGAHVGLAYALTQGLHRRNQIDDRFFGILLQRRPLQQLWGGHD